MNDEKLMKKQSENGEYAFSGELTFSGELLSRHAIKIITKTQL